MQPLKRTAILVSNRGHAPTRKHLQQIFDAREMSDDTPGAMAADERATIKAIATLMTPVGRELIDALPNLEIVSSFGVGYDHVDAAYAASKNIVVTHTPSVLDDEVADTTIGLLLNTLRELPSAERWLRDGKWKSIGNYRLTPLTLRDRKVGIYGLGRIGRATARRLEGFGVEIHYHSRNAVDDVKYHYHPTLMEMATACDTIIVIVPGTPQTRHAINADILKALGPNGVLVNVGRGMTVDETALAQALESGTIAAAGLDVFEDEPHVPKALMDAPNTVLLPHVASASEHTRAAMGKLVIDNLTQWFSGGEVLTAVPECADLPKSKR